MVKRVKNHKELHRAIANGMEAVSNAYGDKMQQVITEPRQWEAGFGITHRRNGEIVVGSFRNIVDLGNLKQSQTMDRQNLKTTYEWDGMGETPAVIVHEGATLRNGNEIPPRRWTEVAADDMDWAKEFAQGFNS
jgi:hypothetical protein